MAKWLYQIKLGIFGQGGPRGLVNKMAIALDYSPDLQGRASSHFAELYTGLEVSSMLASFQMDGRSYAGCLGRKVNKRSGPYLLQHRTCRQRIPTGTTVA